MNTVSSSISQKNADIRSKVSQVRYVQNK